MKAFRFPLESLLTVRRFKKDQAAQNLQQARAELMSLRAQLEDAQKQSDMSAQKIALLYAPRAHAANIAQAKQNLGQQLKSVSDLNIRMQQATAKVEQCLELLVAAQAAEESVINLKEKRMDQHRSLVEAEDEKVAAEFVASTHVRRQTTPIN